MCRSKSTVQKDKNVHITKCDVLAVQLLNIQLIKFSFVVVSTPVPLSYLFYYTFGVTVTNVQWAI